MLRSRSSGCSHCPSCEEQRGDFVALAADRGCDIHAVWLNLPKEVLHNRVRARVNHPTGVDGVKGIKIVNMMLGMKAGASTRPLIISN